MSIYLQADDEDPGFIASNVGWGDVVRWSESLSGTPVFKQLCSDGFTNDVGALVEELKLLTPPPNSTVASTLGEIFEFILDNKDSSSILVC